MIKNCTKNSFIFFATTFVALVNYSCQKPPIASTDLATQPIINALDTFKVHELDFKYLNAKAKVKYKDLENEITATVHIRVKKDSLIWISIVPAMGIEASRCLITNDSVYILDRINDQYHHYGYEALEKKINIHLSYHIIQSMLLGSLPFPKQLDDKLSKSINGEYFILSQKIQDMEVENFIKTNSMKLEKFDVKEKLTNKSLHVVYSNFTQINQFSFPFNYIISITYPLNKSLQNTFLAIEYNKVELPDKDLTFPFNVPNKYLKK